jgi:hypothetical protein
VTEEPFLKVGVEKNELLKERRGWYGELEIRFPLVGD